MIATETKGLPHYEVMCQGLSHIWLAWTLWCQLTVNCVQLFTKAAMRSGEAPYIRTSAAVATLLVALLAFSAIYFAFLMEAFYRGLCVLLCQHTSSWFYCHLHVTEMKQNNGVWWGCVACVAIRPPPSQNIFPFLILTQHCFWQKKAWLNSLNV